MAASRGRKGYRRGRAWDVIVHHYGGRRAFTAVYRDYEARVRKLVETRGMPRERLELSPQETTRLFDTDRLRSLLTEHVAPLRDASHALFRDEDQAELYDTDVSKIYHELSILKEEHLSVRDFPRDRAGREFARLFREVSQYYPQRLRRVRNLFARAQRLLEALLPGFREDAIVLRSAFLFRGDLWPDAPEEGFARFLGKMFPDGGAAAGFLVVARSFHGAGFLEEAAQCARVGIAGAKVTGGAGAARAAPGRDTIGDMEALVARAEAEWKALQEADA